MNKYQFGIIVAVAVVAGIFGGYIGIQLKQSPIDASPGSNGPIFSVASSTGEVFFIIRKTGLIGVNTLTPKTNLDVTGLFRAWWVFPPKCTTDIEGAFTYDRSTHHFVGCDGATWRILDN